MAKVFLDDQPPVDVLETAVKRINHIMAVKRRERDVVAVANYANLQTGLQKLLADLHREVAREKRHAK